MCQTCYETIPVKDVQSKGCLLEIFDLQSYQYCGGVCGGTSSRGMRDAMFSRKRHSSIRRDSLLSNPILKTWKTLPPTSPPTTYSLPSPFFKATKSISASSINPRTPPQVTTSSPLSNHQLNLRPLIHPRTPPQVTTPSPLSNHQLNLRPLIHPRTPPQVTTSSPLSNHRLNLRPIDCPCEPPQFYA